MNLISKNLAKIALLSFLAIAIMPTLINGFSSSALADETGCSGVTQGRCDAQDDLTGNCGGTPPNCVWMPKPESEGNALEATICNLLSLITGTFGKAFAAFAVISVGVGFFTGKVSWGLMIGVAAGIAAIFGAPSVVAAIAGGEAVNPESCKKAVAV